MASLINQDSFGNTFYNYITPLVKGESGAGLWNSLSFWNSALTTQFGPAGTNWDYTSTTANLGGGAGYSEVYHVRFPAPGLESKTGAPVSGGSRINFTTSFSYNYIGQVATGNTNNTAHFTLGGSRGISSTEIGFLALNDYALVYASFNTQLTSLTQFTYMGWLREPSYTGSTAPRGVVGITNNFALRSLAENVGGSTDISTANNSITNPPIVCAVETPGADITDIVIRDNAAPNYAIGKLYHCVSLPPEAVVGGVYKNNGVDPEGTNAPSSYLCIMPWGGRKLGMRVWTENFI